MTLYDRLPTSLTYEGKKYRLNLSFDRVLQFYDVQKEQMSDAAKLEASLFLLVRSRHRQDLGLLLAVAELLFAPSKQPSSQKSFDFEQDAKYIYAAFRQAYGVDLFDERDKLHWWKFLAMLDGLPSDTRFMEIVQIRLRPLPKANKHNGKEIQELLRQKAVFRLEISEEERQRQTQAGLAQMVRALEGMAYGKS